MNKVAKGIVSLSAVLVLCWSGAGAAQSAADEGAKRGFNPQPEPPKFMTGVGKLRPGTTKGFNPQPEPPAQRGSIANVKRAKTGIISPGTTKGFNPQPEPPAAGLGRANTVKIRPGMSNRIVTPGTMKGFNPQPEPPAVSRTAKISPKVAPAKPLAPTAGRVMTPAVKTR